MEALVPIAAGAFALHCADGLIGAFIQGVPGGLVLMSGLAVLFLPGNPRNTGLMAFGALIGVLLSVPLVLVDGFGIAIVQALLMFGSFLIAGKLSLRAAPIPEDLPNPDSGWRMEFKAGFDEAILGYFVSTTRLPDAERAKVMAREAEEILALAAAEDWEKHPERFHRDPPPPENLATERRKIYGHSYELVSFDSGFVPPHGLPGAGRWETHMPNRRAVASVLRHDGPPRPWLMCIHGYRMGIPWSDFSMFSPDLLHHGYGYNVIMPILPLHGPRKVGRRSGDLYLDGDLVDLLYAEAQALWDLRRWMAWLREQDPACRIGVQGISLGGYNAALLSAFEPDIDFVLAGIPAVDLVDTLWRFLPEPNVRYFENHGLDHARYSEVLRIVSPLRFKPLQSPDRLGIFAATGDRVVGLRGAMMLAEHWGIDVQWYQGSHLSMRREAVPGMALEKLLDKAGWSAPTGPGLASS